MKKVLLTITLFSFIFILGINNVYATPAGDNVIISEVEYDSIQSYVDQDYEWFELYNPKSHTIDISGWHFTDGEGNVVIPNGTGIAAGAYFLAVFNTASFQTNYPGVAPDLEYGGLADANNFSLANGDDEMTLQDDTSTDVDFVSWEGNTTGWSIVADAGESIARSSSTDTDTVSDWLGHQSPTPGTGSLTMINFSPVITSNGGSATATVDANENQTAVTTVSASDPDVGDIVTYGIYGGNDQALFSIDTSTGILTFTTAPDFENPTDSDSDGVYEVDVSASDSFLQDVQSISVTIDDINENPIIISNGGGDTATISVAENQTAVTTITVSDEDLPAQTLTYSIIGGVDAGKFTLGSGTGVLTFTTAPDFENPTDSDTNNTYVVQIRVVDGGVPVETDVQIITVIVTKLQKSSHRNGFGRISKERLAEIFGKVDSKKEQVKNKCSFIYFRLIRFGTHGEDVKALQVTLNALGFNTGVADGWYGPNTYKGIVAFQNVMKIAHDGIFGPQSTEKLMKKCSA